MDIALIEGKRKALDELETRRIEDARQKEQDNYTTFGTLLNDFLDNLKSGGPIAGKAVCVEPKLQQSSEPADASPTGSSILRIAAGRVVDELRAAAESTESPLHDRKQRGVPDTFGLHATSSKRWGQPFRKKKGSCRAYKERPNCASTINL